jgi:hypothetical protein
MQLNKHQERHANNTDRLGKREDDLVEDEDLTKPL